MNSKVFLTAVLILLAIGCIGGGEEKNLEVIVTKFSTMEPLFGVPVGVYDLKGNLLEKGTSDADGLVSFNLPPGIYHIMINATGYEGKKTEVSVQQEGIQIVDVGLVEKIQCEEDWNCTDWSECVNGTQYRACLDSNECRTKKDEPEETQNCTVPPPPPECDTDVDCGDNKACTVDECVNGSCTNENITYCSDDDGCCPSNCDYTLDNDCTEPSDCTKNSECTDSDSCTEDLCVYGECINADITDCIDNDGCCPDDCDFEDDDDCEGCEEDWNCTDWSDCDGDAKTRECTDQNSCGTTEDKPDEEDDCCEDSTYCASNEKCVDEECVLKNCTEQSGDTCVTGETCPYPYITASDTDYCCNVTCVPETPVGDLYFIEGSFETSGFEGKGTLPGCSQENSNLLWFDINSTFSEILGEGGATLVIAWDSGYGTALSDVSFPEGIQPGINTAKIGFGSVVDRIVNITLDYSNIIEETNETNNEVNFSLDVPYTDHFIQSVTYHDDTEEFEIILERNATTTDCPWFLVSVFTNGQDYYTETLESYGNTGNDYTMQVNISVSPKPISAIITTDFDNRIIEPNETNNVHLWTPT